MAEVVVLGLFERRLTDTIGDSTDTMTVLQALHAVFTAVGAIIAIGGGATAIAYGVFRLLGRSWIDHYATTKPDVLNSFDTTVEQPFRPTPP
jgi:hypothetical protein